MKNTIKIIFVGLFSSFLLACIHSTPEIKSRKTSSIKKSQYHVISQIVSIGNVRVSIRNDLIYDIHHFKPVGEKNAVFTDSVLRKWNNSTAKNIASQYQKYQDSNLIHNYLLYFEGEYHRLEFAKFSNKKRLFSKKKLKDMILIEYVGNGTALSCHIITINSVPKEKYILCTDYYYSNRDTTWLVQDVFYIDTLKFKKWVKCVKRSNKKCVYRPYHFRTDYVVSFFGKAGITSKYFLTPFKDVDLESYLKDCK